MRLVFDRVPNAILVPQRAVTELLGKQFVTVVAANDKTEQRPVTLGDRVGRMWIVKSGLSPGERIVVEGLTKAPPGTTVAPTMITEAQLDNPPPPTIAAPPGASGWLRRGRRPPSLAEGRRRRVHAGSDCACRCQMTAA